MNIRANNANDASPCDRERLHYWIGFMSGVLNGISMRSDIPQDVRETCIRIVEKHKKELNPSEQRQEDPT